MLGNDDAKEKWKTWGTDAASIWNALFTNLIRSESNFQKHLDNNPGLEKRYVRRNLKSNFKQAVLGLYYKRNRYVTLSAQVHFKKKTCSNSSIGIQILHRCFA
jgi:hypothetical protein